MQTKINQRFEKKMYDLTPDSILMEIHSLSPHFKSTQISHVKKDFFSKIYFEKCAAPVSFLHIMRELYH